MEVAKIEVVVHGPAAEHNMPCAVCGHQKAVLNMNNGVFLPCWGCQESWRLVETRPAGRVMGWVLSVLSLTPTTPARP